MYILHPGSDRTDEMIHQQIYWYIWIKAVQRYLAVEGISNTHKKPNKDIINYQITYLQNIPGNKICVDIIVILLIIRKGKK